ncbi:MAG: hypothetical protein HUJ79_03345, partial [Firmicutes bacterium]|nr:hypothetical protein [Bacillota bacterium]
ADSNAKAYSITAKEQEISAVEIAGLLLQDDEKNLIIRALEPASNVKQALLEVSELKKGSEPTKREGIGLSEESVRNLMLGAFR